MHSDAIRSIGQFSGAWKLMNANFPGNEMDQQESLDLIHSGSPIAFFNVALITGPVSSEEKLTALALHAADWMTSRVQPWILVTTAEAISEEVPTNEVLAAAGLVPAIQLKGMIAEGRPAQPDGVTGLDVLVPNGAAQYRQIIEINSAAYGMDFGVAAGPLGSDAYWRDQYPAMGQVGADAVTCASVIMVDGHRYVLLVATHPDHQRQGYATETMKHALRNSWAAHPGSPAFLHATDAGAPVYERLGFRTVATHTAYMDSRFLDGH